MPSLQSETERPTGAQADTTLRMSRVIAASRLRVFRAFTDPSHLVRWWGPEGYDVPEIRLDPRPGGEWRTCMRSPTGSQHCVGGVYKEVSPPERLVLTWIWDGEDMDGLETLVTLEFHEAAGGTELRLTHEALPSVSSRDKHGGGWGSSFDCLEAFLREEEKI